MSNTEFNIMDHEKFIWRMINRFNLRGPDEEDVFNEFIVYFYEQQEFYKLDEYKPTTIIKMSFKSFWTHKIKNNKMEFLFNIEDKNSDYSDMLQAEAEDYKELDALESEQLLWELDTLLDELTREYLLEGGSRGSEGGLCNETAKKEGVTRQTINKRINNKLREVRKVL